MELGLQGKVALVTGASRGIGLAIVRALVAEGVTVVGAARTVSPELAASGAEAEVADLSTAAGPGALVAAVLARHGGLDVLVNNVGGGAASELRAFDDYDDAGWRRTFDLNLFSAVRACRAAMPSLVERHGVVVTISSIGARLPHNGPVPYNVAKAALTAYSKALAEEYADRGVRAVTVSPGMTRTPLWTGPDGIGAVLAAAQGVPQDELIAGLAAAQGMRAGEMVEPEQIASLVAYLASPLAAGATGHDYVVDGGAIKTA